MTKIKQTKANKQTKTKDVELKYFWNDWYFYINNLKCYLTLLFQVSVGSEQDSSLLMAQDDNSNDALVIVDDDSNWSYNDGSNSGKQKQILNLRRKLYSKMWV